MRGKMGAIAAVMKEEMTKETKTPGRLQYELVPVLTKLEPFQKRPQRRPIKGEPIRGTGINVVTIQQLIPFEWPNTPTAGTNSYKLSITVHNADCRVGIQNSHTVLDIGWVQSVICIERKDILPF